MTENENLPPVSVPWRDRHLNIAAALEGGSELLAFAERRDVIEAQREIVVKGGKPVLAYAPLFEKLGLTGAEFDSLKRFSGEVAAFVMETMLDALRAPGGKAIVGHAIFASAQPFRFPHGSRGRALSGAGKDQDDTEETDRPGTDRFLKVLAAILETAERHELTLARNVVDEAIARRPI